MEDAEKYKNKYRVESARRVGWDYSRAGEYFITICTKNKEMFFGDVVGEGEEAEMRLSEIGKIAKNFWLEIPQHFDNATLDEFIVMPNHIHGIIIIYYGDDDRRDEALPRLYEGEYPHMSKISPKSKSLPVIIGSFKSIVTKTINQKFPKINFGWQERFYDHIIKNEKELYNIRDYIYFNVLKWHLDRNNPKNLFIQI